MKKLFFCVFLLVFANLTDANPIVSPQAFISELKFEDGNQWVMEITFKYSHPYNHAYFDSICVVTSGGSSRIRIDNIKDSTLLFVITSDSLISPLSINSEGDFIKIYSYTSEIYHPEVLVDSMAFGNYPGSVIPYLQDGYSITRLEYNMYCKDQSPTIGVENDSVGTCGTIKGFIYDKDFNPVTSGNFYLENPINLIEGGIYSTSVYARKFIATTVYSLTMLESRYQVFTIDTLIVDMNPDSLVEANIHFTDLVVLVKEVKPVDYYKLELLNYPNPFNSITNFLVKIPSDLKYNEGQIDIYNIKGERVFSISFFGDSHIIWDGRDSYGNEVSSGIYYYRLLLDNSVYKNGSMVLLK